MQHLRDRLAKLQADHDARKAEIEAMQRQLREGELIERAGKLLDSLPADERGVVVNVAAIRLGSRATGTKGG